MFQKQLKKYWKNTGSNTENLRTSTPEARQIGKGPQTSTPEGLLCKEMNTKGKEKPETLTPRART